MPGWRAIGRHRCDRRFRFAVHGANITERHRRHRSRARRSGAGPWRAAVDGVPQGDPAIIAAGRRRRLAFVLMSATLLITAIRSAAGYRTDTVENRGALRLW